MKLADDWFKLYKHQSQTVLFILSSLKKISGKNSHNPNPNPLASK